MDAIGAGTLPYRDQGGTPILLADVALLAGGRPFGVTAQGRLLRLGS